jgi:hypothetical protein
MKRRGAPMQVKRSAVRAALQGWASTPEDLARVDEIAPVKVVRKRAPRKLDTRPSEGQIQRAIMTGLRLHPIVVDVTRYNSGSYGERAQYAMNSSPGHSDIGVSLKSGMTAWIEVKRPGEWLRYDQALFLITKLRAWNRVGVARSIEDAVLIVEGRYSIGMLRAELGRIGCTKRDGYRDPAELTAMLDEFEQG